MLEPFEINRLCVDLEPNIFSTCVLAPFKSKKVEASAAAIFVPAASDHSSVFFLVGVPYF